MSSKTPQATKNAPAASPELFNTQTNATAEVQKNTAISSDTDGASVITKLKKSLPLMETMKSACAVSGNEIGKNGKVVDRIMNFVDRVGSSVFRPGFGDVLFSRSKIKSSMIGHGVGDAKIETFAAVPDVIRNGIEIDHQKNWKGRNYDTYMFAAPIDYKGNRTYLGVVVQKDSNSNRYYLHEVVDSNGNIIYTNETASPSASDGTSALSGDLDTVAKDEAGLGDSPFNISIPNSVQNVNGNLRERGFSENIRSDAAMEAEVRAAFETDPSLYQRQSNEETLVKAKEIYNKGTYEAEKAIRDAISKAQAGFKLPVEMIPLSRLVANDLTRQGKVREARDMLGNLKTQERNIVGNIAMLGVTKTKNLVKTGIESVASAVSGGKYERASSFPVNGKLRKEANADADLMMDALTGNGIQNILWRDFRYANLMNSISRQNLLTYSVQDGTIPLLEIC